MNIYKEASLGTPSGVLVYGKKIIDKRAALSLYFFQPKVPPSSYSPTNTELLPLHPEIPFVCDHRTLLVPRNMSLCQPRCLP